MKLPPVRFSAEGLSRLAASMRRYLAQKQAREQAQERLQAAYGHPAQADGSELVIKEETR